MRKSKKQSTLEKNITSSLRQDWNPIGGTDLPKDEYISYVPRIYEALSENCDAFFLCQILMHIQDNVIGSPVEWYKTLKVAELLIEKFQDEIMKLSREQRIDRMVRLAKQTGKRITRNDFKFEIYQMKTPGDPYREDEPIELR